LRTLASSEFIYLFIASRKGIEFCNFSITAAVAKHHEANKEAKEEAKELLQNNRRRPEPRFKIMGFSQLIS
jgi:hypothetical protein